MGRKPLADPRKPYTFRLTEAQAVLVRQLIASWTFAESPEDGPVQVCGELSLVRMRVQNHADPAE